MIKTEPQLLRWFEQPKEVLDSYVNEEAKQYEQRDIDDILILVEDYSKAIEKLAKEAIHIYEVLFKGADPDIDDEERNLSVGRESIPLSHWERVPSMEIN